MARITPSTAEYVQLDDFEPYKFNFKEWEWSTSSEKYGSKRRVQVTLAVEDSPDDTVLDWLNCALGKQRDSGAPSKLTEFLNAFAGKPPATEIAWFDDESGDFGYEDASKYASLNDLVGHLVIVRGRNKPRQDGEGTRYRPEHYQSAASKAKASGNGGRSKPKPAEVPTEDVADDTDIPF